jgi:hypothetical protein
MEDRQEPLINSCLHPGLLQPRVWPLPEQEEEAGASSSTLPFSMMQGGQTRVKWRVNGSWEVDSSAHVGLVRKWRELSFMYGECANEGEFLFFSCSLLCGQDKKKSVA